MMIRDDAGILIAASEIKAKHADNRDFPASMVISKYQWAGVLPAAQMAGQHSAKYS